MKFTQTITSLVTVERILDSGGDVVVIGWSRGAVNATGTRFDVPAAHVRTLQEGRVVRCRYYIDHPPMRVALDATRPSDTSSE